MGGDKNIPLCEHGPAPTERRQFYKDVISGKAKLLGGSDVRVIDGRVVVQDIPKEELLRQDVERARKALGLDRH